MARIEAGATAVKFAILGPLAVSDGDAAVNLGGVKARSLLALFLLNANEWLSSDRLIEELWAGDPPRRAPAVLQVHVANLRKALEPERARGEASRRVVTHAGGYRLPVVADELDWLRFEQLAGEGREALARGQPAVADHALRDALALWRGPLLADLADEPFVAVNAARFDEARLAAYESQIETGLALARHHELVGELEQAVTEHPLRERLWGHLMLALYRSGRQAEALRTFGRARAVLVEELGIEPGPELQALERALLEQDAELAAPSAPVVASEVIAAARPRATLPQAPNRLVGRDDDVDALTALIGDAATRLVTVTGAGGIGKSRLAIAAAARAEPAFADGVVFVWLASVPEPHLVGPAIARALEVEELPGHTAVDTVRAALAAREVLLVLDNFEHVLRAAPVVAELLAGAPGLRVLVTSRSPLRIAAEKEYELVPLTLPNLGDGAAAMQIGASGAVELFVERARAARRTFELTPENADAVASICTALDGLPLAIELAAARTRVLTPDALLERLGHRLDLLTGGARDAPDRQRTLRATIEWSYDLLTSDEGRLFLWLGVFRGWFNLRDVEAVCADALGTPLPGASADSELVDLLASLVEQSLVRQGTGAVEGRFAMFQTVRELARERLAATRDARHAERRHRDHFLALALDAHDAVNGPREAESFARLDEAADNLQAALASAAEQDGETFERLCTALAPWWMDRAKYTEAAHWTGLALGRDDVTLSGELVMSAGVLASRQDDFATAIPLLQRAHDALVEADPARAADCLTYLGEIAVLRGELDAAAGHAAAALDLATAAGDGATARYASYLLGWVAEERGDLDEARRRFDEDLAAARANDVPAAAAHALATIAELDVLADDLDTAEQRIATARALLGEGGNPQFRSYAHRIDGFVALGRGDGARAAKEFSAALDAARALGRTLEATWCLGGLASAAVLTGDAALGACLFSAAHQLRTRARAAEPFIERRRYEPYLVAAREQLGAEAFGSCWNDTSVASVDDALELLSGSEDRAW